MLSIKFNLHRSTTIKKPIDTVYNTVSDFSTWNNWSPWLCQEPECPVDISGIPGKVGHEQAWKGKRIGSGRMKIFQQITNERIDYDLFFITPWKSHSKVSFLFKEIDDGTLVKWSMEGTLPFFLFFMKKMMSAWVGSDYERGLSMLKEYIETGEVLSKVEVNDIVERNGFSYIGQKRECSIDEVGPSMDEVFTNLQKESERRKFPKPDFTLSFYHKYDLTRRYCKYTSGYGYFQTPTLSLQNGYVQGEIHKHRALNVNHIGPYRHLGNAWSTTMGCQRNDKLKVDKKIPMYEIYETMPGEVNEKDIKTLIYLPVK